MRRAALLVLGSIAALSSAAFLARAQDRVEMTQAELHRVRGTLAFQRAVWGVSADGFQRAATELQRARDDEATHSDFTVNYLLGISYMRLGRLADAEPAITDARLVSPTFPGFWLTDAMRAGAMKPDDDMEAIVVARDALVKYGKYLDGMPKDGPLADEFRFLGLVLRGTLRSRVPAGGEADPPAGNDQAILDLNAARELAAKHGAQPSSELISILAHVQQSLNQTDKAKRLILEAMAHDPAEAAHYLNYGVIVAGVAQDEEARQWFEQALSRRASFPEAHVKLAYLDYRAGALAPMRIHLDAAQTMIDGRAKSGSKTDARAQADLDAGYGIYWREIGLKRTEKGDETGARDAYLLAEKFFRSALAKEPACASAINHLILTLTALGAPQSEIDILKKRLAEMSGEKRKMSQYKSTFC